MKVRFYRGPMNGKVREVRDTEWSIQIVSTPKRSANFWSDQLNPAVTDMPIERHVYNRTQHTHPDGSVFFEWSRPRGSKK